MQVYKLLIVRYTYNLIGSDTLITSLGLVLFCSFFSVVFISKEILVRLICLSLELSQSLELNKLDSIRKRGLSLNYHNHRLKWSSSYFGDSNWSEFYRADRLIYTGLDLSLWAGLGYTCAVGTNFDQLQRFT